MKKWQLQEAKAKFSQIVKLSKKTPQIITVRGVEEVIICNFVDYKKRQSNSDNIVSFFQKSPLKGLEIELKRDKSKFRDLKL